MEAGHPLRQPLRFSRRGRRLPSTQGMGSMTGMMSCLTGSHKLVRMKTRHEGVKSPSTSSVGFKPGAIVNLMHRANCIRPPYIFARLSLPHAGRSAEESLITAFPGRRRSEQHFTFRKESFVFWFHSLFVDRFTRCLRACGKAAIGRGKCIGITIT